ncbi:MULTISPECIES: c-type cytochrome [unclassified Kaistella]|uniref:c-type cytochrome n=1 Tax=unclassified Kaistella TaxID=2762626 RepID=UPI00273718BB|nr:MULTISPECIES: c-type cytochrome [unclassified Kaistella]MDP2454169.1 c-type cytochrome [Kaistella sp. SH11-4b]MDP2457760.1 c-type cytochrome [Kaistella sp. SH40-3]MDP2460518.1 c-type cytochrome [Kaistella sp. SH19-2b]
MKTLKTIALATLALALISCGGDKQTDSIPAGSTDAAATTAGESSADMEANAAKYDPNRGLGKHENVDVSKFDPAMAAAGKKIADVKCTSCHKPTDEKLVGPGWLGVTKRQTPEWIMNFISNPDPMIDVDPELQKQLELCLVRMPNQGLSDTDAREVLEYMREIDGAK